MLSTSSDTNVVGAPLLSTKLSVPLPRSSMVSRPRLTKRLDEALQLGRRVTVVSAPAGSGKTTLVAEWVAHGKWPVAWLSLDEGENDPVRFLRYLIASLQQVDEGIGLSVKDVLQAPQLPPLSSLVASLINDITDTGRRIVLILDDHNLVTATPSHEILQFLVEQQPHVMHLVIVTRDTPPLPLPLLRVRDQVTEIRAGDLSFTAEEAVDFLNGTMGLQLTREQADVLKTRTEGWIAGLQLAALALREAPDGTESFIDAFAGDDRYVRDYLATEVVQRQPRAVREFLRRTAILDRMTAPLCDAVTGREDSEAILDRLENANLFLLPLDHRRDWYRYNSFFAEFLRTTVGPEEESVLHQRAMQWYESHGFKNQAIRHALDVGSGTGEWADAERLISSGAQETFQSGAVLTLLNWLERLPDRCVRENGRLATYRGWISALTGEMGKAREFADAAESHLDEGEASSTDLGKLLALRAFIVGFGEHDYSAAIELSAEALRLFGQEEPSWRVVALWAMAESQERTSPIEEAISTFYEARRIGLVLGNPFFVVMVEITLIISLNNHGERRQAMAVCTEAIERYGGEKRHASPWVNALLGRLGILYYESNELDLSSRYHEHGLSVSEQFALGFYLPIARGLSAPTLYALGETDGALAALQEANRLAGDESMVDANWFVAWDVHIRLMQGDLAFALRWVKDVGFSPDDEPQYVLMESHLVYARVLLADGHLLDGQRWLARLERFCVERGLLRPLISVRILQSLAADTAGDRRLALDLVAQAVEAAAPQDYVRAFIDEDERIMTLLADVRHVAPRFVDKLLIQGTGSGRRRGVHSQPLIEALSDRELEVLGLIDAGMSNRDIAETLIIATGTVKRHINNIYGKLGVHSRTQAVNRARELQLLDGEE